MRPFIFAAKESLLLRRTRRSLIPVSSRSRRRRVVLHRRRRVSKAVAESTIGSVASGLHLHGRLIGRGDQKPPVKRRIVHKLPLIVFLLFIELADRVILACARDPDD